MTSSIDLRSVLEPVLPNPCILLVIPSIVRLQTTEADIRTQYYWPFLFISEHLSIALISEPVSRRGRVAKSWLQDEFSRFAPGPLVLAEIDLLFEPELALDPLALLRQLSRKTQLIILWPGTYINNTLTYAVPEHAHYRIWRRPEVAIVLGDRIAL